MYLSRVSVVGRGPQTSFLHRTQLSFLHGIAAVFNKAIRAQLINRPCLFSSFSRNKFIPASEFNVTTPPLKISTNKMSTNGSTSNGYHHSDDFVLQQVLDLVRREKLLCDAEADSGAQKVVEFVHPKELERCLGGLEIGPDPTQEDDVKTLMEKVIRYSVKTCHHRFYNQVLIKTVI